MSKKQVFDREAWLTDLKVGDEVWICIPICGIPSDGAILRTVQLRTKDVIVVMGFHDVARFDGAGIHPNYALVPNDALAIAEWNANTELS